MAPRPATTGYERLAQADRFSDDSEDDDLPLSLPAAAAAAGPSSHARPRHHRSRRNSSSAGVDLKAINARLERWADEIASKFKRGKGRRPGEEEERLEIHHSVFRAPEGIRPIAASELGDFRPRMTKREFEEVLEGVRTAIEQGMHPRMISQGSSGSYFARNTSGKVVGVFKPKDEEPYAAGNPKWNKWIHRNLFPCCFGRACLIPNLSYVSEAAAYTLDFQLRTNMVPYTDVVYLSSKAFHYPFWDRLTFHRKKKPLPSKPGSFQVFLTGFRDANIFLREHPWPDQYVSGYRAGDSHRKRRRRWADSCRPSRPSSRGSDDSDDEGADSRPLGPNHFFWTETLKQSFREELEKLVILDYIMRNTDRGLDNWMVKVDWETQKVSITSEAINMNMSTGEEEDDDDNDTPAPRPVDPSRRPPMKERASHPYKTQGPMKAASPASAGREPDISIGAIDNSLSWPWKHPDAWRSFPFGWLFLPVDLIGRPFSEKTRKHFLPLLTSTQWWSQTQYSLRKVFQMDPDFKERMFARQMAVMKGQAWNVVETLKTPDHGPLELTRRAKVCVWDDLVDVPVAVPMRATSSELRRARDPRDSIDEVDIGAAASSVPTQSSNPDLLGLASPPTDMPHPGRFELTSPSGDDEDDISARRPALRKADSDPEAPDGTPRPSLQVSVSSPRGSLNLYAPQRQRHARRHSHAGRRHRGAVAQNLYGDLLGEDAGGDLGYAAAEGMEGSHRKVIVERLEMVKAKNPVFSCW